MKAGSRFVLFDLLERAVHIKGNTIITLYSVYVYCGITVITSRVVVRIIRVMIVAHEI